MFCLIFFLSYLSHKSYGVWYHTTIGNIDIFWERKVSSPAMLFVNLVQDEIDSLQNFFGRKIPETTFILFYEKDGFFVEISSSRIFLVNLGGTRVEELFPYIRSMREIVKGLLGCAFLQNLPQGFRVIPPGYLLSPKYILSFCEYVSMGEDFFNFPFYGSIYGGTIKFIEREYGSGKVFDLFLNGKIIFEDFSLYQDAFLRWRKSKFIYNAQEIDHKFEIRKIHGINILKDQIITFSDRYLISASGEKILKLDFSDEDFGYINGDEKHLIFDAREGGKFSVFILDDKLHIRKIDTGGRAWYPDILSDLIVFVRKDSDHDELCVLKSGRKPHCVFATEKYGEIFTPDISPDGKNVVFSLKRGNGFFDIGILEIETGKIIYITQDRFIDVFPKWIDSSQIAFSSNRSGPFNIFIFNLRDEKLYQLTFHNEGVITALVSGDKIYSIVWENFHLHFAVLPENELQSVELKKESIYSVQYERELQVKRRTFGIDRVGILIPYVYGTSSGFFFGRFIFYALDNLYRNNFYFGIDWRLPFYKVDVETINLEGSPSLGFFIRTLFRFSNPYIFAKFGYSPFFGLFVRKRDKYYFFPERVLYSDIFFIYQIQKTWIFWGVDFSDYRADILLPSGSFKSMVEEEYEKFGKGFFVNPQFGLVFRGAEKGFYLKNGFDAFLLNTFYTRNWGFSSKFSIRFFSPEISVFILSLGVNGFANFSTPKRFYELVGSKDIPVYLDPPYDMSPLFNFSPISFDMSFLGYDIGNIRGVSLRRSDMGLMGNFRTYINIFRGNFDFFFNPKFVNLIPFISGGLIKGENFLLSYGTEIDLETEFFFSLPLTLKFGIARGEITEFYFAFFITPGVLR